MGQVLSNQLQNVLKTLASDCGNTIKPYPVILTKTSTGTRYSIRIPNPSKKQVIGWSSFKKGPSIKFNTKQPAVIIRLCGSLLNEQNPEYRKRYFLNSNYGSLPELVYVSTCSIGDDGYELALAMLVEAASNLISGKRYEWKGIIGVRCIQGC